LIETDEYTDLMNSIPIALYAYIWREAREFKQRGDSNNFIAARWILFEYFHAQCIAFDLNDILINYSGKPYLNNGYQFSISHTRGLTGVLIGPEPLGLDIELIHDIGPVNEDDQIFTKKELEHIEGSGVHTFFRLWTAKEAILKLAGAGIADGSAIWVKIKDEHSAMCHNIAYHIQPFVLNNFFITIARVKTLSLAPLTVYHKAVIKEGNLCFETMYINERLF
jgi:phosphopantetheinyl transferase